jgi:hypothetical protein
MALPGVSITLLNGQLGLRAASEDGVAGLLATGVAVGSIALGDSVHINSLKEAEDLGVTAAYDTTNTTNVHKCIADFYKEGDGPDLWFSIVAKTNLMAGMVNVSNNILKKLLNDAGGKIRICAVTRVPDVGYTPTYTNQIDADVINAIPLAQALASSFATGYKPVRILLDARDFQGTIASLGNLKSLYTANRVSLCLVTDVSGSKNAAVGLPLGRLAGIPVQRNIGRVKDGPIITGDAFLTGQSTKIETIDETVLGGIHDKGYIIVRKFASKTGYFFNDDPTATAATDDYSSFARGRVIDKAIVITNRVYTDEILDDLDADDQGFIDPAVMKTYQATIDKALKAEMVTTGNATKSTSLIDPKQNVLALNKIKIDLRIRPKFYSKNIDVKLGFENPFNA